MEKSKDNEVKPKILTKKIKISIIILMIFSVTLLIYAQIPRTNAKTNINYAEYYEFFVGGTDINVTINANVGILEDGGISLWGLTIGVFTNSSILNVVLRGISNGSKVSRGITLPTSNDFKDDTILKDEIIGASKLFSGMVLENLLLAPDIYGIPNLFTFDLEIFVGNSTKNNTLYVSSEDKPLVAFIFQNTATIPEIGTLFFGLMYGLPFLLPIAIIIVNTVHKKIQKKKELKLKEGGAENEK
ncbi:MAG: hypothetical protein ACFFDN_45930 [Candidatus Hodarchaeota archaeon]